MSDRIYNAIILLDEPGGRHFYSWLRDKKKLIETRMKNMIPEGDIVICCSNGSMTADRGKASLIVRAGKGRPMTKEDEALACIESVPGRIAFDVSDHRYFSRKFDFTRCKVGGTYQAIFQIKIPDDVQILN
jgi:hypothetical protein